MSAFDALAKMLPRDPNMGSDAILIQESTAEEFPLRVVFERKHIAIDTGMGLDASLMQPTAFYFATDLEFALIPRKDRLQIGSLNYLITDVHPDGHGGVLLILKQRT